MSDKHLKLLFMAIIFSLCLHLFLWMGLDNVPSFRQDSKQQKVEVVVLDTPKKKPIEADTQKTRQIVEQPSSVNKEKPKDAKYLSAENQKVNKETRAKKTGSFRNRAQTYRPPPQAMTKKKPNQGTLKMLKDFIPKSDFHFQRKKLHTNKKNSHPNQSPAKDQSASSDYLKDTQRGIHTLLNTREFMYYSYYHRIRVKIQNLWEPSIKKKVVQIFSQSRNIASSQDRITKTIIVLNSLGELVTVQVISESGIRDLDEVAVEAFRAAEPFPNPPKGIADANGQIKILWDFVLEM